MLDVKKSVARPRGQLLASCAAAALAFAAFGSGQAFAQVPVFDSSPTTNVTVAPPPDGANSGVYTITQTGARGIANWTSFDVGANTILRVEIAGVNDPSGAITLNRVLTGSESGPSIIAGRIESPGQFWIVNQQGVYIGASGTINVAAFLASSADIPDADFLAGGSELNFSGGGSGLIVNEGTITIHGSAGTSTGTASGTGVAPGYVVLSGAGVSHQGLIGGELTQVVIGGAEAYVLRLNGSGVFYEISEALRSNPGDLFAAIEVGGEIRGAARVLLTASAIDTVYDSAVNMDGVIEGSQIVIDAAGDVTIAGSLDAAEDVTISASQPDTFAGPSSFDNGVDITITSDAIVSAGRDVRLTAVGRVGVYGSITADQHVGIEGASFFLSGLSSASSGPVAGVSPFGSIGAATVSVVVDDVDIGGRITADAAYFSPNELADIYLGGSPADDGAALVFTQTDLNGISAPEIIFSAPICDCGRAGVGGSIFINGDVAFGAPNTAQRSVFLFGHWVRQETGFDEFGSTAGRITAPQLGVGAVGSINLGFNRNAVGEFAAESGTGAIDLANSGPLVIAAELTATSIPEAEFDGRSLRGVHAGVTTGPTLAGAGGDSFGIRIDNAGTLSVRGDIRSDAVNSGVLAFASGDVLIDAAISARGAVNSGAAPATNVVRTDLVIASTGGEVSITPNASFANSAGRFLIFTGTPTGSNLAGLEARPYFNTAFDPRAVSGPPVAGNRVVFRAPAELVFESLGRTRFYGDANPDFSDARLGVDWSLGGDFASYLQQFISDVPVLSTLATETSNVGAYPIAIDFSSINLADFNVTAIARVGDLTVAPAPIGITAAGGREYGLENTFGGVSIALAPGSFLRLGQTLADVVTVNVAGFSTNAAQASNVGSYTLFGTANGSNALTSIIPAGADQSNYDISFVDGVYAVTPAPLTLLVSGAGVAGLFSLNNILVQAAADTPLRSNDTIASIATLAFSTPAGPTASAGEYSISTSVTPILPAGSTSSNYDITVVDGIISIARNGDIDTSVPPLTDPDAVKETIDDGLDNPGNDGEGGLPRAPDTPIEDALMPGDDLLYRSTIANNGNDGIW